MTAYGAHETYLETTVRSSDPLDLTRLLYRTAIDALRQAAAAQRAGDIATRGRQISRTQAIVGELLTALDERQEISRRLAPLYEYLLHITQVAQVEQRTEPLDEARRLLETLLEAWQQVELPADADAASAA
jgi:flagellar protein FliS